MEERITYREIRAWFLGCYYNYCRAKVKNNSPWVEGESEAGYAYSELEKSFDMPVENLMLEVLSLILGAGRSSDQSQKYHRGIISELLSENNLSDMLKELPEEEAEEFKADLKLLKLY